MDDYQSVSLENPAHKIIYKNIYGKFFDITDNKQQFQDESRALYKEALDKYKL
jgi:hypothetical protein